MPEFLVGLDGLQLRTLKYSTNTDSIQIPFRIGIAVLQERNAWNFFQLQGLIVHVPVPNMKRNRICVKRYSDGGVAYCVQDQSTGDEIVPVIGLCLLARYDADDP